MEKTVTGVGFMPDEGDIVFEKRVRRIDGWILCHLRFVLEVTGKGEGGRYSVSSL